MRIVLTGFGPFPGVEVNPSDRLLECLPLDLPPLAGHEVEVAVLPVTWRACQAWVEVAFSRRPPDILLHIGVRAAASDFNIERFGRNACRTDLPDAEGTHWPTPVIIADGPPVLPATLPTDELMQVLAASNLPFSLSDDAGGYVCNFILYNSLHQATRCGADTWAGFLHIPRMAGLDPAHPAAGLPLALHVRALSLLLTELIDLRQQNLRKSATIEPQ